MFGLDRIIPSEYLPYVILGLISVGVLVLARLSRRWISRITTDNRTQYHLRKATSGLSYFLIVITAFAIFGRSFSGLGVALGVAGAGIAFALQEVIVSIAGWIAISFGGFYHPGDRVQLGGITGDVIDVGVLRTTILETGGWVDGDLYNGRIVRVANSFVFKEPVFNYSGEFPFLWDELTVPIRHSSDHKVARELIVNACTLTVSELSTEAKSDWDKLRSRYRLEDASLSPMVSMTFNENWIIYTVRYVVEYKFRRLTKDRVFERILDEIKASDGKVEIAVASIEVTNVKNDKG